MFKSRGFTKHFISVNYDHFALKLWIFLKLCINLWPNFRFTIYIKVVWINPRLDDHLPKISNKNLIKDKLCAIFQNLVSGLADVGVYTILDAHQDVLWQYGDKNDKGGYWGVPPWIKDKLKSPVHEFPWPFEVDNQTRL